MWILIEVTGTFNDSHNSYEADIQFGFFAYEPFLDGKSEEDTFSPVLARLVFSSS